MLFKMGVEKVRHDTVNFRCFMTVYYVPKLAAIGAKLIGPKVSRPSVMNRRRWITVVIFFSDLFVSVHQGQTCMDHSTQLLT